MLRDVSLLISYFLINNFYTGKYEFSNKMIGEGSFGKVYIVKSISDDKLYATKIINAQNIYSGEEQLQFMQESSILHKLDYPSIILVLALMFMQLQCWHMKLLLELCHFLIKENQ